MPEFKPTAPTNKTEKIKSGDLSVENINTRINLLQEKTGRDPQATKILEDYKSAHMKLVESMLPKKKSEEMPPVSVKASESSPFDNDSEANKLRAAAARTALRQSGQNIQPRL